MDYQELKASIEEIVGICQSVPEPFRDKCFEMLLASLLRGAPATVARIEPPDDPSMPDRRVVGSEGLRLNAPVIAFLRRRKVTEQQLETVVMMDDGAVHFTRQPKVGRIAAAQAEWALLLALKRALEAQRFEVDAESIRAQCQDKGCYDKQNFAAILKRNRDLFQGDVTPNGGAQKLSDDGEIKLAELIKSLAQAE